MRESLGETPMISFHTWSCMCEGVGRDSGYFMSGLITKCDVCDLLGTGDDHLT